MKLSYYNNKLQIRKQAIKSLAKYQESIEMTNDINVPEKSETNAKCSPKVYVSLFL